jgi:hypothetical protein
VGVRAGQDASNPRRDCTIGLAVLTPSDYSAVGVKGWTPASLGGIRQGEVADWDAGCIKGATDAQRGIFSNSKPQPPVQP